MRHGVETTLPCRGAAVGGLGRLAGGRGAWVLLVLLASLVCLNAPSAGAVQPDEMLSDPVLESRARALSAELRCVVCQNQSIDDSDAPLAHDLRVLVRERLQAGDSDEEVKAYLVDRYGTFVLLSPPVARNTFLLWTLPFVILLIGLWLGWRAVRSARRSTESEKQVPGLSDDEQKRLADMLDDR
jgi:cytochrome c-type biogenesis protein CcmH